MREGGREGGKKYMYHKRENKCAIYTFCKVWRLKVLSHDLSVCTGSSVLYFNMCPTSVFQITHI